jgi:hypothetical protein
MPLGAAAMIEDKLAGINYKKLKAKCLEMMMRVFGVSHEDAEAIYCQVMKEQASGPLAEASTWTTERPVKKGWYWHRRSDKEQPSIVLINNYDDKGFSMFTAGNVERWPIPNGEWIGPLKPTP